jgi:hypothetical protein
MIANPSALLDHADRAPDNGPKDFIIVYVHFGYTYILETAACENFAIFIRVIKRSCHQRVD